MTKTEADSTGFGNTSTRKGKSKGGAAWVLENRPAHDKQVSEQLHEGEAGLKGDAPGVSVADINHGRHDLFRFHMAFSDM